MVAALAIDALLPPSIIEQIVTKADGVPLFVEEITRAVIDAAERKSTEARRLLDFQSYLATLDNQRVSQGSREINIIVSMAYAPSKIGIDWQALANIIPIYSA